ncbi:hypothetical protein EG359_03065 [Chryseobacterium joostei]|uniref:Uncharacterized protein n=1 Tax=Chryseobacterium joostei TaxID=112234 RepID=A0A1N7HY30_9FLAO|nr:hypothetical protein [Chryseobacterium joostei]AZA98650.1 hypothetical protein EG359_03065 [Chryseobacterium joostei]SIS29736.1 hypothetical protein SAMN05421768_101751 [Chryseobacterium joostei]
MNIFIYVLIITLIFTSCNAQKVIETTSKDVLVFEFISGNIQLAKYYSKVYNQDNSYKKTVEASENKEIFNNKNISVVTQEWKPMGSKYYQKKYTFIQQKDTMNIYCKCGQEKNYYIKNLEFKRGNYNLNFELPKDNKENKASEKDIKYIAGSEIINVKEMQKTFFKNTYSPSNEPTKRDLYFSDLKFIEIDVKNTANVYLQEIK